MSSTFLWLLPHCIPSRCPTQTPTQSRIPRKFLCHVVSQGGQALVLQNSHPGTGLTLTHAHIHTHQSGVSVQDKQDKNREIPFFVVMTLFTWWRLEYKNEKCRCITFDALSTCCSNIYETTLWILFLYNSKFLLMSDRLGYTHTHTHDFFTLTCINRDDSQGSYITHRSNRLLLGISPPANSLQKWNGYAGCVCKHLSVKVCWWGDVQ